MNDYKIAIIGNSPVSEIVSLLLGNNFEVTCYKDTVETAACYPYFANDLNEGILKKFIEKTNISLHERNSPDIEIKYDQCATFVCQVRKNGNCATIFNSAAMVNMEIENRIEKKK